MTQPKCRWEGGTRQHDIYDADAIGAVRDVHHRERHQGNRDEKQQGYEHKPHNDPHGSRPSRGGRGGWHARP